MWTSQTWPIEEDDEDRLWVVHGLQPLESVADHVSSEMVDQQRYITTDPDHSPQSHFVLLPLGKVCLQRWKIHEKSQDPKDRRWEIEPPEHHVWIS